MIAVPWDISSSESDEQSSKEESFFLKTDSEYISYTGSCLCYQQGKSVLETQILVKYLKSHDQCGCMLKKGIFSSMLTVAFLL